MATKQSLFTVDWPNITHHPPICKYCAVHIKCSDYAPGDLSPCANFVAPLPPVVPVKHNKPKPAKAPKRPAQRTQRKRRKTKMRIRSNWPSRFNGPPCQGGSCMPK